MRNDSSLFKYELAIVAILKNEALYIKEWLDYHLLAGVNHFYLYDNESTDNIKEILQPYIENNIVDYRICPGKTAQMLAYNDALQSFKFDCKYMAFIDIDEFILPKNNKSIIEVINEVFALNPNIAGLAINWHIFGSSDQENADFSKGVLQRFLHRAENNFFSNEHIKTIANPRYIDIINNPHFVLYYDGKFSANENGEHVPSNLNKSCTTEKICVNHYFTKSKEEFIIKCNRGRADLTSVRDMTDFYKHDKNDVYDDEILNYMSSRQMIQNETAEQINQRLFDTLVEILSPLILPANLSASNVDEELFQKKLNLFLTCLTVSKNLGLGESDRNFFEELSLKCIYKSLSVGSMEVCQIQLLLDEIPNIINIQYPVVDKIKDICKNIIPELMQRRRTQNAWIQYKNLDRLSKMLQRMLN